MIGRSWLEIDIKQIIENYKIYASLLKHDQRVMAVVKADAYGHGETRVAKALFDAGVRDFAVSNIEEAINIRRAGVEGQILVLGYTPTEFADKLCEYDITQAIISDEYAEKLIATGYKIKAQVAIDTGMNRIGLDADESALCEALIRGYAEKFELNGIFTHLCAVDTDDEREFTDEQISKFCAVIDSVSDLSLPYVHCMNSAAGLWHNTVGNLVRLGIVMYGLKPDVSNDLPRGIRPALVWKSAVSMIKTVRAGETIGYGRSYAAERDMRIATIPTGYADGYSRELSNRGCVIIRQKKARIVGRVCMDQMMIDVSDIPDAAFADEVILLGDGYDANDMASDIGTIGYEIICGISKRVPRIYL